MPTVEPLPHCEFANGTHVQVCAGALMPASKSFQKIRSIVARAGFAAAAAIKSVEMILVRIAFPRAPEFGGLRETGGRICANLPPPCCYDAVCLTPATASRKCRR